MPRGRLRPRGIFVRPSFADLTTRALMLVFHKGSYSGAVDPGGAVEMRPDADRLAAAIARDVAAAPPFSATTLEKLAVLIGPIATEVRLKSKRRPSVK